MKDKEIILHQFPNNGLVMNYSPFCMKLELYLRMVKLPYSIDANPNPSGGPKGKMPYASIDKLQSEHASRNLDGHLNEAELSLQLCVRRTLEEHLYWAIVYSRWQDPEGLKYWKKIMAKALPRFLSLLVYFIARKAC